MKMVLAAVAFFVLSVGSALADPQPNNADQYGWWAEWANVPETPKCQDFEMTSAGLACGQSAYGNYEAEVMVGCKPGMVSLFADSQWCLQFEGEPDDDGMTVMNADTALNAVSTANPYPCNERPKPESDVQAKLPEPDSSGALTQGLTGGLGQMDMGPLLSQMESQALYQVMHGSPAKWDPVAAGFTAPAVNTPCPGR